MKITITVQSVADEASRLIIRAAAGHDIDPLQQLRSLPADAGSVSLLTDVARAELVGKLGCYYGDMQLRGGKWSVELWHPAWMRRVDDQAVSQLMHRLMALTVAAHLLLPTCLAQEGAAYSRQADNLALTLVQLLDTLSVAPTPPPGSVRRRPHPF